MRIIRDVPQGSPEWLALRAGRVTASNFGKVLAKGSGETRRKYMLRLLAERLSGLPQDTYTNAAMEWGTQQEPRARAVYELLEGVEVEEVTMVERDENVSASPDGLLPASGIEIKCPNTETHLDWLLRGGLPSMHKPQVQGCMWICERDRWEFVSFDPRLPEASQTFVTTVTRDDTYIANLEAEVDRFVDEMLELEHRLRGDAVPGLDDLDEPRAEDVA